MLESLAINDFQRWDTLEVEFSPTVTCFTCPTDGGKSSTLRALRWLALNKPNGDSFIRNGEKATSVRLKVDSHQIARNKGAGLNSYFLDQDRYVAFGQGAVPEPVAKLLNVDESNFQTQLSCYCL